MDQEIYVFSKCLWKDMLNFRLLTNMNSLRKEARNPLFLNKSLEGSYGAAPSLCHLLTSFRLFFAVYGTNDNSQCSLHGTGLCILN